MMRLEGRGHPCATGLRRGFVAWCSIGTFIALFGASLAWCSFRIFRYLQPFEHNSWEDWTPKATYSRNDNKSG